MIKCRYVNKSHLYNIRNYRTKIVLQHNHLIIRTLSWHPLKFVENLHRKIAALIDLMAKIRSDRLCFWANLLLLLHDNLKRSSVLKLLIQEMESYFLPWEDKNKRWYGRWLFIPSSELHFKKVTALIERCPWIIKVGMVFSNMSF